MDDAALRLRLEVEDLYYDYLACLDDNDLERWPEFFTDDCVYRVISRENYDRGLPLAVMYCRGKGMLLDRVQAIRKTSMYAPRSIRRLVSAVRPEPGEGDVRVRANYAAFQTLVDEETQIFSVGRYVDRLVRDQDGRLRFAEKLCVYDSVVIPNSLIYPL